MLVQIQDEIHLTGVGKCRLFAVGHGPVHDDGFDVETDAIESLQRTLGLSYYYERMSAFHPRSEFLNLYKS